MAIRPNTFKKFGLLSAMDDHRRPVSWYHMSGENEGLMTDTGDNDHEDAIVAACHLLLLSNSLQEEARSHDKDSRKPSEDQSVEESDSFTPRSFYSSNSRSNPSNGSVASHNQGTASSSMLTQESDVISSDSNTAAKATKRKVVTASSIGGTGGRAREIEILERPARKRRYRSLSGLMRQ